MSDKLTVFDLKEAEFVSYEQLGTKEKFWFKGYWDDYKGKWLSKTSRPNTGEHWSEKAAEELCIFLGIPHAVYHLAIDKGRLGVVTESLVPEGFSMIMGNQLLHAMNPKVYPEPENNNAVYTHIKEHTVDAIFKVFDEYGILPSGSLHDSDGNILGNWISPKGLSAQDVFCGYLLLDALISNQDRHHENWAILEAPDKKYFLCPTFDHAASLGRELTDLKRKDRLSTKDKNRTIEYFVTRAKSELFASDTKKRLSTLDAFFESVKNKQSTKIVWLNKLNELSEERIVTIFDMMPDSVITQTARDFCVAMILANKKRLLEDERS
jgi:hypothetical protein